jgi:hypothetical protein
MWLHMSTIRPWRISGNWMDILMHAFIQDRESKSDIVVGYENDILVHI